MTQLITLQFPTREALQNFVEATDVYNAVAVENLLSCDLTPEETDLAMAFGAIIPTELYEAVV